MTQENIDRMSPEEHLKSLAQANKDYWSLSSKMQSQWRNGRDPGEEAEEQLDALWAKMHALTEIALNTKG